MHPDQKKHRTNGRNPQTSTFGDNRSILHKGLIALKNSCLIEA